MYDELSIIATLPFDEQYDWYATLDEIHMLPEVKR